MCFRPPMRTRVMTGIRQMLCFVHYAHHSPIGAKRNRPARMAHRQRKPISLLPRIPHPHVVDPPGTCPLPDRSRLRYRDCRPPAAGDPHHRAGTSPMIAATTITPPTGSHHGIDFRRAAGAGPLAASASGSAACPTGTMISRAPAPQPGVSFHAQTCQLVEHGRNRMVRSLTSMY